MKNLMSYKNSKIKIYFNTINKILIEFEKIDQFLHYQVYHAKNYT